MYPGLNDTDIAVAMLHHRALVAEGQYQQSIERLRRVPVDTRAVVTVARRQAGMILTQVGARLLGAPEAMGTGLGSVTHSETGTAAS